jgi:hypothetical protein
MGGAAMQIDDTVRARFLTMPDPFPGSGKAEKQYPVRKATVVYVHPKGRYIVAECKGVRETFFPEDIIQCDLPGPPPMDYDLEYALVTLTEVDKKIMGALGRNF